MILEPIVRRRAHLSFSVQAVPSEKLLEVFEAASLAPSSGNNQPWRYFYAIHGTAGFDKLFGCLDDGNQRWAGKAGVLVLSAARIKYTRKGKEYSNPYAWHDTGLANALLMIQAVSHGFKTHPMAGFDPLKAREATGLGADFVPVAMIAIGYPGNESELPEDLLIKQNAPRNRKPFDETVSLL